MKEGRRGKKGEKGSTRDEGRRQRAASLPSSISRATLCLRVCFTICSILSCESRDHLCSSRVSPDDDCYLRCSSLLLALHASHPRPHVCRETFAKQKQLHHLSSNNDAKNAGYSCPHTHAKSSGTAAAAKSPHVSRCCRKRVVASCCSCLSSRDQHAASADSGCCSGDPIHYPDSSEPALDVLSRLAMFSIRDVCPVTEGQGILCTKDATGKRGRRRVSRSEKTVLRGFFQSDLMSVRVSVPFCLPTLSLDETIRWTLVPLRSRGKGLDWRSINVYIRVLPRVSGERVRFVCRERGAH